MSNESVLWVALVGRVVKQATKAAGQRIVVRPWRPHSVVFIPHQWRSGQHVLVVVCTRIPYKQVPDVQVLVTNRFSHYRDLTIEVLVLPGEGLRALSPRTVRTINRAHAARHAAGGICVRMCCSSSALGRRTGFGSHLSTMKCVTRRVYQSMVERERRQNLAARSNGSPLSSTRKCRSHLLHVMGSRRTSGVHHAPPLGLVADRTEQPVQHELWNPETVLKRVLAVHRR